MVTLSAAGVFALGVFIGFIGGIVVLAVVATCVGKKKK